MLRLLPQQLTASDACPDRWSWATLQTSQRDLRDWAKHPPDSPRSICLSPVAVLGLCTFSCLEEGLTVSWCHQGAGFEMQS